MKIGRIFTRMYNSYEFNVDIHIILVYLHDIKCNKKLVDDQLIIISFGLKQ